MAIVEAYATVDVALEEFSDSDLLEEIEKRQGASFVSEEVKELVQTLYQKKIFKLDYSQEIDQLIYEVLGRIV